jgi:hypothetical protein
MGRAQLLLNLPIVAQFATVPMGAVLVLRNSEFSSAAARLEAAKKAGAFVTPTDPKLAPNTPEGYRPD